MAAALVSGTIVFVAGAQGHSFGVVPEAGLCNAGTIRVFGAGWPPERDVDVLFGNIGSPLDLASLAVVRVDESGSFEASISSLPPLACTQPGVTFYAALFDTVDEGELHQYGRLERDFMFVPAAAETGNGADRRGASGSSGIVFGAILVALSLIAVRKLVRKRGRRAGGGHAAVPG